MRSPFISSKTPALSTCFLAGHRRFLSEAILQRKNDHEPLLQSLCGLGSLFVQFIIGQDSTLPSAFRNSEIVGHASAKLRVTADIVRKIFKLIEEVAQLGLKVARAGSWKGNSSILESKSVFSDHSLHT